MTQRVPSRLGIALLLLVPIVDDHPEAAGSGFRTSVHTTFDGQDTYRSLLSKSGCSSLRRAVSVCMNLLKGVSFFLPPVDDLPGRRHGG